MHRLLTFALVVALAAPAVAAPAAPRAFTVEVSGRGAPVILIPGLSCGGDVWRATVERYRGAHELHVVTLAGFAGVPAIAPPMLSAVRDALAAYIRAHHLERPVIVGHSLGGFLALWLAASAPDLVGGVVVVDSLPFLPAAMDASVTPAQTRARAESMRAMFGALTPAAFAAQNRAALATMITDAKNVDAVAATSSKSDARAVAEAVYELMTTDLRPLLAKVRAPTLVLAAGVGEKPDDVRAAYEKQYASLPGHTLVVAERARHFIMLDDPAFFFARVDEFFAHLGRGA